MLRPRETGGEQDLASFWRGVGERRGGEVGFTSFATYMGRAGDGPADLAGLLYRVGDRFWFEDFERESWLLRILPPRRPFAKTEISFERASVTAGRVVARTTAYRCLRGGVAPGSTAALGRVGRLFTTPVVQLLLADGSALFFEVMRERDFLAELGR
ncbi:MAG: hypothetical protein NTU62_10870 [Spirochaetes bacterium]|nr:hypothetical protein [Spirochaetota bacterium]